MKKRMWSLLIVVLAAAWILSSALADTNDVAGTVQYGTTIDKVASRSGPGTQYSSTGTYRVKGQSLRILSYCYDVNDVCWLQVEVPYGDRLRRVYTGLKRFDPATVDLTLLPEEIAPEEPVTAAVRETSDGRYGPGKEYGVQDGLSVQKGLTVTLLGQEGDWAFIEFPLLQPDGTEVFYRCYVEARTLVLPSVG